MMAEDVTYLLEAEELELGTKGDEVRKEGVEVTFAAEVDEVGKLRMVNVRKDPE